MKSRPVRGCIKWLPISSPREGSPAAPAARAPPLSALAIEEKDCCLDMVVWAACDKVDDCLVRAKADNCPLFGVSRKRTIQKKKQRSRFNGSAVTFRQGMIRSTCAMVRLLHSWFQSVTLLHVRGVIECELSCSRCRCVRRRICVPLMTNGSRSVDRLTHVEGKK